MILFYHTHPYSCEDVIKYLHDKMKWDEWQLLLTFWRYVRRRIICFEWSWITELWQCQWLDVRNRWCQKLGMLGRMELDGVRFHHITQNRAQFKTYKLFISGIFHLIFSGFGWLRVTETKESETADKGGGGYCNSYYTRSYRSPMCYTYNRYPKLFQISFGVNCVSLFVS